MAKRVAANRIKAWFQGASVLDQPWLGPFLVKRSQTVLLDEWTIYRKVEHVVFVQATDDSVAIHLEPKPQLGEP